MADLSIAKPPGTMTFTVAASIASHILALAIPLALLQAYDRILPNEAYGTTAVLAIGVTVAIILEGMLRYGRSVLFAYAGSTFESEMTVRVVDRVMHADNRALRELSIPDLSDAVRSVGEVRDFWSGSAAVALHELPFAVIYIVLIAYIASWLALIPVAFTILALLAAFAVIRSAAKADRDAQQAQLQRQKLGWGIFTGIVEAKTMAAETMLTQRYREAVALVMDATARLENRMALIRENGNLMAQLSTIGIVAVGASMVITGQLTTGALAACTLLAGRSVGPAMEAFGYLSRRNQRGEAEGRISKALSIPLAPLWEGEATEKRRFTGGDIVLSGPALHRPGDSVSIPQGAFVHIDAPNSPVATMTLRTVLRLEDSLGLSITFEGRPIGEYDPHSFRQCATMASSHGELIRGTLLDNLTLFSPNYEAPAIQLSERLGLSTFVDGLRQGYVTSVGPGGADIVTPGISARIGLIRAIVRQPLILCLDDADGSLDLDGVTRLTELLKEFKGHTTVFIVSSRPALQQLADIKVRIDRRRTET